MDRTWEFSGSTWIATQLVDFYFYFEMNQKFPDKDCFCTAIDPNGLYKMRIENGIISVIDGYEIGNYDFDFDQLFIFPSSIVYVEDSKQKKNV